MHGGSPWLLLTAVMAVQDVFIGNFPHGIGFIALRANLAKSSYLLKYRSDTCTVFFQPALCFTSSDLINFSTALCEVTYCKKCG